MQQNYYLDIGYIYYNLPYGAIQTVVDDNITNQDVKVVLQNYLPILYGQVFLFPDTCPLPKKLKPRSVEIELQDSTKYKFDIPFNSSNTSNWTTMLNQLESSSIKSWVITGEKIPAYKLSLLLTKVP